MGRESCAAGPGWAAPPACPGTSLLGPGVTQSFLPCGGACGRGSLHWPGGAAGLRRPCSRAVLSSARGPVRGFPTPPHPGAEGMLSCPALPCPEVRSNPDMPCPCFGQNIPVPSLGHWVGARLLLQHLPVSSLWPKASGELTSHCTTACRLHGSPLMEAGVSRLFW